MMWNVVMGAIGVVGAVFMILGVRRLFGGRPFTGSVQGLAGIALVLAAVLSYSLMLNLHTYHRFTKETAVAEIAFRETAPQQFIAILTPEQGQSTQSLALRGDEWQMDARILKWHGYATLLGFDPLYQLERLSGRYRDIEKERTEPRSVHSLAPTPAGLDLWSAARSYGAWFPLVDAVYGNATYLPMRDGARFEVRLTVSGLVARPLNPAAEEAVRGWQ